MIANRKLYLCADEACTFDPNYRYRVDPPRFCQLRRKGVSITEFENSKHISQALELKEEVLIKMIGAKVSCPSGIDKHTGNGYFRGLIEEDRLTDIVCSIVQAFVLCRMCEKPDVDVKVKRGEIKHRCRGCPASYTLDAGTIDQKMYDTYLSPPPYGIILLYHIVDSIAGYRIIILLCN
jgi:hypothetical protein